jgi:hypothetical protein
LNEAEVKIEALRKAKDRAEVSEIELGFSDRSWEKQLEDYFDGIKEQWQEVGGREICRLLILNHLGRQSLPDYINFPDQVERAVELGVYDDDSKRWNSRHENVMIISNYVDRVRSLLSEYPSAVNALKERGEQSDPANIRFWEYHLSLK